MKERTFTYSEFVSAFFPNLILQRLEKNLCEALDLKYPWQHWLIVNKEDPRCGMVEVAKKSNIENIRSQLKRHYESEGYKVEENGRITMQTKNGNFEANILETETSFAIWIRKQDSPPVTSPQLSPIPF